jgi:hypothetical protein
MYLELTPEDTVKDLSNLLIAALPKFEFPRINLYDYTINVVQMPQEELVDDDFVVGQVWGDIPTDDFELETPNVIVDRSYFNMELTSEEVDILAILMKQGWV